VCDIEKAIEWYEKVAIYGHTNAQFMLTMYYECTNLDKSMQFCIQASDNGEINARKILAERYEYGKHNGDLKKAIDLYRTIYPDEHSFIKRILKKHN
jgi:TPR repeat protein